MWRGVTQFTVKIYYSLLLVLATLLSYKLPMYGVHESYALRCEREKKWVRKLKQTICVMLTMNYILSSGNIDRWRATEVYPPLVQCIFRSNLIVFVGNLSLVSKKIQSMFGLVLLLWHFIVLLKIYGDSNLPHHFTLQKDIKTSSINVIRLNSFISLKCPFIFHASHLKLNPIYNDVKTIQRNKKDKISASHLPIYHFNCMFILLLCLAMTLNYFASH